MSELNNSRRESVGLPEKKGRKREEKKEKKKKKERCRRPGTGNHRSHGRRPSSSLSEIRAIRRATVQTSVTTPFPLNEGVAGSEEGRARNVLKRALLKSGLTLDYLDCRSSCAPALNRRLRCRTIIPFPLPSPPAESRGNKSRRRGRGRDEEGRGEGGLASAPRSPSTRSGVIIDVGN